MTTILLARHGETDWNRDHKWQGFTGPPLNETGRRQAHELAVLLEDVHAIYSSDTVRANETALIAAEHLGLTVTTDSRLREVNFGEWEGLTRAEINERYEGAFNRWDACEQPPPEYVEPDAVMADRVLAAIMDIVAHHPGERVLVVTSGGPIRAVQAHLQDIDQATARLVLERVDNCALLELEL